MKIINLEKDSKNEENKSEIPKSDTDTPIEDIELESVSGENSENKSPSNMQIENVESVLVKNDENKASSVENKKCETEKMEVDDVTSEVFIQNESEDLIQITFSAGEEDSIDSPNDSESETDINQQEADLMKCRALVKHTLEGGPDVVKKEIVEEAYDLINRLLSVKIQKLLMSSLHGKV